MTCRLPRPCLAVVSLFTLLTLIPAVASAALQARDETPPTGEPPPPATETEPSPEPDEEPAPPRRSSRPGLTPEEAAAPTPEPEAWAGRWYSEFGYMELDVEGDRVTGTYSCCDGSLEGVINLKRLEVDWKDPIYGEGWAWLYWKPAGNLEGIFGKMEDMGIGGRWNAVRPPEPPAGAHRYRVDASHPRFQELDAEVLLALPGEPSEEGESARVKGLLRGHYDLMAREKPYRYVMLNQITGRQEGEHLTLRWMDPVHLTQGEILLERGEGGAWVGTWEPHFLRDETLPFALHPVSEP